MTISFKDIFLGRHLSEIIAFNEEEKIKKEEEFWSLSTKLQSSGFLWKGYRSSLLSLVIERALSFKTHVDSYQSLASTMSILQMKLQAKYHRKNTTTSIYTIKSTYLVVLSSGDQGHDSGYNNNIFILVKIFQCLKYFEYSLIEFWKCSKNTIFKWEFDQKYPEGFKECFSHISTFPSDQFFLCIVFFSLFLHFFDVTVCIYLLLAMADVWTYS